METSQSFARFGVNVGPNERLVSVIAGSGLVMKVLSKPSKARLPLILTGGLLIYRGLTGRCGFYRALKIEPTESAGRRGIRVERAVTIAKPRPEVYSFWRNFENFPKFMRHLESVTMTSEKTSKWVAKAPLGQSVSWEAEITEEQSNQYIAWQALPGSQVHTSGMVHFKDAPGDRGTEVYVYLTYIPPGGSAGAAFAKILGEEPDMQVREDLRRFKQVLEAGEVASIFGQSSGRIEEVQRERAALKRGVQDSPKKDVVQAASEASFPASDPPSWPSDPSH